MDLNEEKPTTSQPSLSSGLSQEVRAGEPCAPPDMVLRFGVFIAAMCFLYLFTEIFYPIKQGSAIIAILTGIVGFYFGAAYSANK